MPNEGDETKYSANANALACLLARLRTHSMSNAKCNSRRPDTIVQQSEEVPLGRCLGLEVPEDPARSLFFADVDLGADVVRGGGLEVLRPLVDEVDIRARSDVFGALVAAIVRGTREGAVVAGADAVAVLRLLVRPRSRGLDIQEQERSRSWRQSTRH
jgi:hypothetical protein